MTRKTAFAPVVCAETRVLILGSLPGDASLAAQQYYAHPRNGFWRLAGAVISDDDLPARPYVERLAALLGAGVGLWDTIASAQRRGSLDGAIRAIQSAPLLGLIGRLPALRAIAFNGAKSALIGRRHMAGDDLEGRGLALIDLPSSSPAHAAMTLAEKRVRWLKLQQFLG